MVLKEEMTQHPLTPAQTKEALRDILAAFEKGENARKLEEARERAGNDMLKTMQTVFPLLVQIQEETIQKYGFTADGDGSLKFLNICRDYEQHDGEIRQMNATLKNMFLPPLQYKPANQVANRNDDSWRRRPTDQVLADLIDDSGFSGSRPGRHPSFFRVYIVFA